MEDNKLKIIGITGGVGAGKSTVAKLYADIKGAYIIFTDNVAKYLQEEGKTCYNLIVEHFGQEILNDDRSIDRAKLAQIVFGNEEELKIHSKDFAVLNDKPWVIEQVVSIDKNHQGLIISNAPDRQPLNKRPAVIIK